MPNETELLDLLLKNRGIGSSQKEQFLNPNYEEHLYDPFLLKDMDKACERIMEAIKKNEKIVIYSDYDCDGIPAAVIMHDFFTKIGYEHFSVYIPHRHDEGYGLHKEAIEEFIRDEVKLLITFDLGITAVDEIAFAQENGIDVIVTDHHIPHEEVPNAYAIINPKQDGCEYPDKMLCGAGLAFKLVQALIHKYGEELEEAYLGARAQPALTHGWEKWLLDMAGLATLADQVPLLNENRVLAHYGLKVLQRARRPGLAELFRKAGVAVSHLTEEDVTFTLAPRLNAASRMGTPRHAFEVLSTTDAVAAKTIADHLAKINDERKSIVARIMKEVKKNLNKRTADEEKSVIVIGNPSWRVGILGLVAAKVAEEYKRPTFVWGSEGSDVIRGSARGWGNVDLVALMSALPDGSLLEFGGHKGAGGFSVSHEEVHFLEERLLRALEETNQEEHTEEVIESQFVEATITIDDVTAKNYTVIEKLAPYGMGNPKPLFRFEQVPIVTLKEFGKDKNHLELMFRDSRGRSIKAIAFFKTRDSFAVALTEGAPITLLAMFEKSTFAGRTELRLRIVDIL
jgi:single-stranded-DNA-specific exonuclease